MNEPKSIEEAFRQAKRAESAQQVISAGYFFERMYPELGDIVAVSKPGKWSAAYWITDGKCNCEDFRKYGDFCKHTLAWDILQADAKDEAEMLAEMCERYEATIGNGETADGCDPYSRY